MATPPAPPPFADLLGSFTDMCRSSECEEEIVCIGLSQGVCLCLSVLLGFGLKDDEEEADDDDDGICELRSHLCRHNGCVCGCLSATVESPRRDGLETS